MRTKLTAMFAAAAAILSLGAVSLLGSGAASAAPSVALGGGSGILLPVSKDKALACTITTIGRDSTGKLIGLTAGHCGKAGQPILAEYRQRAGQIGTLRYTNKKLDYAVIDFNAAKVAPLRTVGGVTIRGISTAAPQFPTVACKTGRTTGDTCGVTWFSDRTAHFTQICVDHGDSGSPVVVGDRLIGMVNAFYAFACIGPETGTNIGSILKDMSAHGVNGYKVA